MQNLLNKLIISTPEFYPVVPISTIIDCKSRNTSPRFFVKSYGEIKVSTSIKKVHKKLHAQNFILPHQSYLIHPLYIKGITENQESKTQSVGNTEIPVSRQMKKNLFETLEEKLQIQI